MAARKPMFMNAEGFSEEMAIADSITLGGLTMGGNILMGTNKVTGAADATADQDLVTKSQLDSAVISGGIVKEALWAAAQLDNTDGINALGGLFFDAIPAVGDQVTFKNGTLTRTYDFVVNQGAESLATDVSIETDAATAMARLVLRVNADAANTQWDLAVNTGHTTTNSTVVTVIERASAAGDSTSRIYGNTWATPADFNVIEFADAGVPRLDYTDNSITVAQAANADPGNGRFGLRRIVAALTDGEIHLVLDTDQQWSWDADVTQWNLLSSGLLPDATSGSGGGIKGKITVDSDFGLLVSSGILKIALTATVNPGLEFDATDKGLAVNPDTDAGIEVTAGGVAIDLAASNPGLQFSTGDLAVLPNTSAGIEVTASGIGIDLAATNPALGFDGSGDLEVLVVTAGGIEKAATGLQIKLDNTPNATLSLSSSGIKVIGVPALFTIAGTAVSANVTATNLGILTAGVASDADALHTHHNIAQAQRVERDDLNAAENLAGGDPVYWSANDQYGKGDAGVDAKSRVIGVNVGAVTTGNPATVVSEGEAAGVGGAWTVNDVIYLADTGGLTNTRPAASKRIIVMGYAMNANDLWVDIRDYGKRAA
jgi:hypothetical protein